MDGFFSQSLSEEEEEVKRTKVVPALMGQWRPGGVYQIIRSTEQRLSPNENFHDIKTVCVYVCVMREEYIEYIVYSVETFKKISKK